MEYKNIKKGSFISRPNRFIAKVDIDGSEITAHVKNTGRCLELFKSGAEVFVDFSHKPDRKTPCDLIAVKKGERLINVDSQAPNKVYREYLEKYGVDFIKPETRFQTSRFDFYTEENGRKIFTEVKGVTLENDGVVMFPDAPTIRGVRHINELCDCKKQGFDARVVFIIQMSNVNFFTPNKKTHPEFAKALKKAADCGVEILAIDSFVTENSITAQNIVEVRL